MKTQETTHAISGESLGMVLRSEKNNKGAEFTVKSKMTGKDFTFKISRSEFRGKYYTHIWAERQYLDFYRVGTYFRGTITNKKEIIKTPASDAISWVLRRVENGEFNILNDNVELMHFGKCILCGATLTDAESIRIGLGPICRTR